MKHAVRALVFLLPLLAVPASADPRFWWPRPPPPPPPPPAPPPASPPPPPPRPRPPPQAAFGPAGRPRIEVAKRTGQPPHFHAVWQADDGSRRRVMYDHDLIGNGSGW